MIRLILMSILSLGMVPSASGQNAMAVTIVKANLDSVRQSFSGHVFYPYYVDEAADFLRALTGIECKQGGNLIGPDLPTKDDLQRWETWFRLNKSFITYNTNTQEVVFTKRVKSPPINRH